jgi:hypothetical protein
MYGRIGVVILGAISLLTSLQSLAQNNQVVTTSDATHVKVTKDVLASRGFTFANQPRPMCKISGHEGTCQVEAFAHGEATNDDAKFTCGKLDRATYVGECVDGKLNGLSLVIADGSKKRTKEAYLSYFDEGRIAYPALTSFLAGDGNFGVDENARSYSCVFFGKWDKSSERCSLFIEIYGKGLFTESNAQSLRDGDFAVDNYRTKFLDFLQRKQTPSEQ